ncbi:unnamed protein product [Acanthoscelides obtectus]|uniref:Uncharacterized protein n=1 Tax=Acanthoscelides obtectus TaxID=200917 RepID=A0A9P0PB21_ACAOB|nr:unnamed protein product [Acanthoscelides obtectus]CAK1642726.1 hypothetical protein AOBTE_LOCUS13184 [Acanthoscelides obtectus]
MLAPMCECDVRVVRKNVPPCLSIVSQ